MCAMSEYDSDVDEFMATFICVPPSNVNKVCIRERHVSVSESEDSFIMFQYGTDEEVESTEESNTKSDETSSSDDEDKEEEAGEGGDEVEEGEDEVDFTLSAIVTKRVRFAKDRDLCHIHNMILWSFAYHQARKGPWEEYARDRDRFGRRIADVAKILTPILDPAHRWEVYCERFQDDALVN